MTKHLKISGRVQGVGFRYSMVSAAKELGVTGWVRNCSDGSVEAVIQGDQSQIESILEWAKKGPSSARVEKVEIFDTDGKFSDFQISF